MKNEYDISFIIPGVRNERWQTIFEQLKIACKKYTYEVIFVSPYPLPSFFENIKNVKYIKDMSTPARALQIGSLLSEGQFMTWTSDDAMLVENSIDLALDLLLASNPDKDIIGMRYTEGPNHQGAEFPDSYWMAGSHADTRLPGINPNWRIPGVYLIKLDFFRKMGGLDCRFEHANFNVHDFSIRAQKTGSIIYLSPITVARCDWDAGRTQDNSAIIAAYHQNDLPLWKEIYSSLDSSNKRETSIDYMNWNQIPSIWARRHDKKTGI